MRRLFQGRMISVDGHLKRMQPNWNCYFIDKSTDRGSLLINRSRIQSETGTPLEWSDNPRRFSLVYPVKAGHSYRVRATKTGYDAYVGGEYDENLKVAGNLESQWANVIEFTADITGYVYLSCADVNHDEDIYLGECGLVFEEIREN